MYLSFFRLNDQPFNLTPDPRYLFLSRSHKEAFEHLLFGIRERKGFIEVVGGPGTGKTTLCRCLLKELDGEVKNAFIFNSFLSEMELLRSINQEFEIKSRARTRKQLIDALNQFLIKELSRGGNAVLLIDEAQNLAPKVLEQVRMLSNLEAGNQKLIQIVLVGQPELHDMLNSPSLRQLNERINVRSFLTPLDERDVKAYIDHRLSIAGSKGDIQFTKGALEEIYHYSQGIPRRINHVCDRALLIAYVNETYKIKREYAIKAIEEIQGDYRAFKAGIPSYPERPSFLKRALLPFSLGLLVAFGLGYLIGPRLLQHPKLAGLQGSDAPSPSVSTGLPSVGELVGPILEKEKQRQTDIGVKESHGGSGGLSPVQEAPKVRDSDQAKISYHPSPSTQEVETTKHERPPTPGASAAQLKRPKKAKMPPGSVEPLSSLRFTDTLEPSFLAKITKAGRLLAHLGSQAPLDRPGSEPAEEPFGMEEISFLAREMNLYAEPITLSPELLKKFVVPCLLEIELEEGGPPTYALMVEADEQGVIIKDAEGREHYYSMQRLKEVWSGKAIIFFPSLSPEADVTFREGMKGPLIKKLQQQMAKAGYFSGEPTGVYDENTKRWVLLLQGDFNLKIDELFGRMSKGILYQLTGTPLEVDKR